MFTILLTRARLLTAAVFASLVLLACHPTLAKSVGADVWNVPTLNDQLRESEGMSDQLDAEGDEVRRRIAVKESIVSELIAGRTTLAEVTAKFIELNATRPGYVDAIRMSYPGATDLEKSARNVISYALARAPDGTHDALSRKLEAELEQMIARSGSH